MLAGERSFGTNGKENFLFPLEIMWLTQGSYTATYSHNGCYAMDFQGAQYNSNNQVVRRYHCPYYAPFSCRLVARWGSSSPMVMWQSIDEVNFIDGTTGYATIGFCHDDNVMNFTIGETRTQGQVIGHTGTYGAAAGADHVHIEAKKGIYNGYYKNSNDVYMVRGSTWLYNLMGVNDTNLYKDYYVNHNNVRVNYNWREFEGSGPTPPIPPTPTYKRDSKFPWVLYAKKFRNGLR